MFAFDLALIFLNNIDNIISFNTRNILLKIVVIFYIFELILLIILYISDINSAVNSITAIRNIYIISKYLCLDVLLFVYCFLYIKLVPNIGQIINGILKLFGIFILILVFNRFLLNILVSEMSTKISNYKLIGLVALSIPMLRRIILYYRNKYSGLQHSKLKKDFLSYFREDGVGINSGKISGAFLDRLINKDKGTTSNDLKFYRRYSFIEAFIIIYISIPLIISGYWKPSKNYKNLFTTSIWMSISTFLIIIILFGIIKIFVHKIYDTNYKCLVNIISNMKYLLNVVIKIVEIFVWVIELYIKLVYCLLFQFILSKYLKYKNNKHSSEYYRKTFLEGLYFLLVFNKESGKIFIQMWALSKYNNNMSMYTISWPKLIHELRINNVKYNYGRIDLGVRFLIKHNIINSFYNKGTRYYVIYPNFSWSNEDARRYVLNDKMIDDSKVDNKFKELVRKINKR